MISIKRYTANSKDEWDRFVSDAKNSSFLHLRDYMDYHSQRFDDCSLMAYDQSGRLVSVLPANRVGNVLYSHQGLTYGGWIMPLLHFNVTTMLQVMDAAVEWLRAQGVSEWHYKPMPHIYHSYPAEEDLYALFRHGAQLTASNVSTTIDLENMLHFNTGAKSSVSVARRSGVTVAESNNLADYWKVLESLLDSRYDAAPVHSLAEMQQLAAAFPNNIRLFTATLGSELLGGVLFYYVGKVVHSQYTAATPQGWQLRVIPAIYHHVIANECHGMRYLDFGTSNEDSGRRLNEGLVLQKCGMGGRAIVYNSYKIDL
ncbi:MAG: GNAT family N-acetyltransferase [Muribaculaceae bacterium]